MIHYYCEQFFRFYNFRYGENDNRVKIPWVCGNFALQLPNNGGKMPIFSAHVTFHYPIVGRIVFRQPKNEPLMDTTIIVEHLIHADGSSLNDTSEHRQVNKNVKKSKSGIWL